LLTPLEVPLLLLDTDVPEVAEFGEDVPVEEPLDVPVPLE
jgi:hypothetical protein